MILFSVMIGFSSVAKLCRMLHSIFLRGSSIPDNSHLLVHLILPKIFHLHPWISICHCQVSVTLSTLPMFLDVVVPAMSPLLAAVHLHPAVSHLLYT
ncbi:hypothetical protein MVEN_01136500 [Mycena venus]|uniref:Uncharacterized protein n=1 Tax=Mycena venus TaxID=2733690 RepID=A0A8H6Y751_9AGAR|nr:hypothetical protein MVEN_01136500 [Mycena venus]